MKLHDIIREEILKEYTVYHGGGNNFDKFNIKKFAFVGCGSMVFGWGNYVTDSIDVANGYAESSFYRNDSNGLAYTYTVEIPDDNGTNYIDWVKPMEAEQLEMMLDGCENVLNSRPTFTKLKDILDSFETDFDWYGKKFAYTYRRLQKIFGSDKAVSLFLNWCGFDGIKYPSNTIIKSANQRRGENFVVFDSSKMKITGKTVMKKQ